MELHAWWSWALAYTYATTGHIEEAEEILHQLENANVNGWNAFGLMTINAALGRMDEYQTMRKDPRFEDFLARFNLPD